MKGKERYFKTKEAIREYELHEPKNVKYNLDQLSLCGIRTRDFEGKNVLDMGCGFGLMLKTFHDRGSRCFGTDISEYAIGRCRARFPFIRTKAADCSKMPFKEKFSLIMCFGTLGLAKKEEHPKFLRSAAKSLEEGGILFANAPNASRPGFMDAVSGKSRSDSYLNARNAIEWEALISEAGFSEFSVFTVLRLPKSEKLFGKNVFLKIGFGDPIVLFAKKDSKKEGGKTLLHNTISW